MDLRLTNKRREQLYSTSIMLTPIAIGIAILSILLSILALATKPAPQDVAGEVDSQKAVADYGRDFMTLWLAGTDESGKGESKNAQTLQDMASVPGTVKLPKTGYRVENIDVRVIGSTDLSGGQEDLDEIGYRLRAQAVVVPPGSRSTARRTFEFDVMAKNGANFQVVALPRQVAVPRELYKAAPAYDKEAEVKSAIGASAQAFLDAYLTPKGTDKGLGSTVGPNFEGGPVSNPLWDTVQLTHVAWYAEGRSDVPDLSEVPVGFTVHALLTAEASSASTTFSTVQVPVTMVVLENGQWAVDGIDEEVFIGGTEAQ